MAALRSRTARRAGFTLVEMLLALTLLGLLTAMLFTSFYTVSHAWEAGRSAIDSAGHADYLMEQLSAALRSAYTPGVGEKYGLIFEDDGEDEDAKDTIEWTKVGPALIGEDAEFAGVPHRVKVMVTEPDGDDHPGGFTVRAWRQDLQLDDFNAEEDAAEICLSPKVVALNCRMLDPDKKENSKLQDEDELNWVDEWTKTNTLPSAIEITLYMEPAEKGEEPIETKRIIELPMANLSQNPNLGSNANEDARKGTSTSVGGGGRRPGNRPSNNPNQGNGSFQPGGMGPGGGRPGGGMGPGGGGGQPPMPGGGGGRPPRPNNGSGGVFI